MPVISTFGAITYTRNLYDSTLLGNAYVAINPSSKNIELNSTAQLVTSTDIHVIANDAVFGYMNDIETIGTCIRLQANATPSLQITGSKGMFAGVTDGSDNLYGIGYENITVGSNFDPRFWVVKIDSSGNLLWRNNYYLDATLPTSDFANGIKLGNDGFLYLVGTIGWAPPLGDACLMKIDNSGTVIWSRAISKTVSVEDYVQSFDIDSSNNIYVVCRNNSGVYYIVKFDNNGTLLANCTLSSGIANGIKCDGSDVYLAIDTGFIKFDSSLNIIAQKAVPIGGSNTGLETLSTLARKIDIDPITKNIYLSFPRRVSSVDYVYINCIDSSYNLLYQNRISVSQQNSSLIQVSPIISGIKYSNDRFFVVFRSLGAGTNNMNAICLPSNGKIPLNGIYNASGYVYRYQQIVKNGSTSDTTYTTSTGVTTSTITMTRATSSNGTGSTSSSAFTDKRLL